MNKTILITGTSSGIGKATAIYFQQKGWNVIATMRSPEKDTELKELENVLLEKLDVLDLESINQAIQNGIEKFGKIDALVNNAGYGVFSKRKHHQAIQYKRHRVNGRNKSHYSTF